MSQPCTSTSLCQTVKKQSDFNLSCSACTTEPATNHRRQQKAFKAISPLSHISKCQNKGQTLHTSLDVGGKGARVKNFQCHLQKNWLVILVITSPGRSEVQLFNSSQRPHKNEISAASVAHEGCLRLQSCSSQMRWAGWEDVNRASPVCGTSHWEFIGLDSAKDFG